MDVIIVGCGQVGRTLAAQLNAEGHNITVIDTSSEKIKSVTNEIDAMGIIGNGASPLVQQQANVKGAELLIAVTNSDELNLLCCVVAKRVGNCHTIARVRDHAYNAETAYLKEELGLSLVINPELAAAEEIARVLRFPSAISIEPFAKGKVELIKFKLPEDSPIIGMSVKDVISTYKCDVLFCTAERAEETFIIKGNFIFEPKDIISFIAPSRRASAFFKKINYTANSVKDAIIVGSDEITQYLCQITKGSGISLKIIEKSKDKCNELAERFPEVTIINADTSEKDVLLSEGIENAGAFLALSDLDEENIILSLYARAASRAKLVTKIKRIDFDEVIQRLELDTVIYPKNITANIITRYVRSMNGTKGSNMQTLYSIIKGKIEASEFLVNDKLPIAGVSLSELRFKKNALIAAIMRGKSIITPRGYDSIQPGDLVIVVSEEMGVRDIMDIFEQ